LIDVTRTLLFLLAASLLSACQSSETEPAAESTESGITPDYVASLPAEQSRPLVHQLANEVVAAETEACNDNPGIDWSACVSTHMLVAFDRYGFLAAHCGDKPDHQALRDCVASGRSGVDWVLAVGGNPDHDFDWSSPERSQELALKKLNDVLTKRCEGRPEEPGDSCFTRLSADLLGLSDAVAAGCAARATLEQRGACIIDAHDTAMYRAALRVLSR
jgi:hypothetical protein